MNAFYVVFAALVRVGRIARFLMAPAAILGAWIMLATYLCGSLAPLQGAIYKVLCSASAASSDCSHPVSVAWDAKHLELEESRTSPGAR
jgi:hypothetical protein